MDKIPFTEQEICDQYINDSTLRGLAKKYKVSRPAIKKILTKHSLSPKDQKQYLKKIKTEDHPNIKKKYLSGIPTSEIAKQYGCGYGIILNLLHKLNVSISNRKYAVNENYFEIIDSEEKAYFLGFLYADGHNKENRGSCSIQLNEQDLEILEKFRQIIYPDNDKPLYYRKPCQAVIRGQTINRGGSYELDICCNKISKDLSKLGMCQQKTKHCNIPNIDKDLIPHFIRGYFDGDGCFVMRFGKDKLGRKKKDFTVDICCTKEFANELIVMVKNGLDIIGHSYPQHGGTTHHFVISGRLQVDKFLSWIYQDCTIFLKRKYKKYLEYRTFYPDHV